MQFNPPRPFDHCLAKNAGEPHYVSAQREIAFETARLLRILDDGVRAAVLKHFKNADLPGSAAKIDIAVQEYAVRCREAEERHRIYQEERAKMKGEKPC